MIAYFPRNSIFMLCSLDASDMMSKRNNNGKLMSTILDHWSHPTSPPRDTQIRALEWLEQNQDVKYLILEALVGAGKSHIGITYANYIQSPDARKSFVLPPQKILQKQYEDSFPRNRVFSS